ncbi:MAG: hypothetical protein ABIU54_04905 [Candidatus Eisenbacteria bacterium]
MKRRKGPSLLQFEHKHEKLAPLGELHRRLAVSGGLTVAVIGVSLAIGVLGYHYLGKLPSWVDCFYNASMILGGMGPVDTLQTDSGKMFASAYAIFSGVTLLTSVGVLLTPVLHRLMHHFHVETDE